MPHDFQALAVRYGTTERTVRRWDEIGVDVSDPLAVAIHLASIQHPSEAAFQNAAQLLTKELETLS
jgi:hypothetical protein